MPRFNLAFSVATGLCFGTLICVPNFAYADRQLGWSDEFNGTSIIQNNWTFDIGNGFGGWGNHEKEYYTSRPRMSASATASSTLSPGPILPMELFTRQPA
jgi:beta-glucanase (GH16 family)